MDPLMQIHQPGLGIESIVFPRRAVQTGRRISFQCQIRFPEQANIHMVEQRRELLLLAFSCGFPYATQRLGHACPILSSERALPARIPLGPSPWLHLLLRWLPSFVRRLHSYYGGV